MSNMKRTDQKWKLPSKKPWSMSSIMASFRQLLYDRHFQIQKNQLDPKVREALEWLISQGLRTEPKRAQEAVNVESKQMLSLIAELATSLWRARRKLAHGSGDGNKAVSRHIEAAFDTLAAAKIEVKDHTGEKYVTGMALKVIAIQPNPAIRTNIITETIKPTIRYKDLLIQRGEVAVETPAADSSVQKSDDSSKSQRKGDEGE
jgi:hypothetical protein